MSLSKKQIEARRKQWEKTHKIIDGIDHKVCSICKEYFPAIEQYFHPNKTNKTDGLHPYCKPCSTKKSVNYQKENREQSYESHRRYRKTKKYKKYADRNNKKYKDNGYMKEYRKSEKFKS